MFLKCRVFTGFKTFWKLSQFLIFLILLVAKLVVVDLVVTCYITLKSLCTVKGYHDTKCYWDDIMKAPYITKNVENVFSLSSVSIVTAWKFHTSFYPWKVWLIRFIYRVGSLYCQKAPLALCLTVRIKETISYFEIILCNLYRSFCLNASPKLNALKKYRL